MYRHWDKQLKELQAQRSKRREEGRAEAEVFEIPDDDSATIPMEHLEKKSLEQAQMGIILLDDDYEPLECTTLESPAQHDAEKSAESTLTPDPKSSLLLDDVTKRAELIRQLVTM